VAADWPAGVCQNPNHRFGNSASEIVGVFRPSLDSRSSSLSKNKTALLGRGGQAGKAMPVRLVHEFLGLNDEYSENDLEAALVAAGRGPHPEASASRSRKRHLPDRSLIGSP
jgi:hypothetical protein